MDLYPVEVQQQTPLKNFRAPKRKANVFQPSFFSDELLNFGGVSKLFVEVHFRMLFCWPNGFLTKTSTASSSCRSHHPNTSNIQHPTSRHEKKLPPLRQFTQQTTGKQQHTKMVFRGSSKFKLLAALNPDGTSIKRSWKAFSSSGISSHGCIKSPHSRLGWGRAVTFHVNFKKKERHGFGVFFLLTGFLL